MKPSHFLPFPYLEVVESFAATRARIRAAVEAQTGKVTLEEARAQVKRFAEMQINHPAKNVSRSGKNETHSP
jgi:hypothetical protein